MKYLITNVCIKCTNMNTFDKYLLEDLKTDTNSKMKYNSLNIKLGLFLVHTFTFVTLLFEKVCKFCRAKLQNQPNKNIGDEHGSFVVSPLQQSTAHKLYELSAKINFFPSIGVAFNSLLSFTSVNLISSEFTFI